jgi:hypothetical protein
MKAGSTRERITGLTVFDETIAITTMGTDTNPNTATARDKVYIYYPMNERYGFSKPKPKPMPQQWTNIQILTAADTADVRYPGASPDTSISMNTLRYVTSNDAATDVVAFATTTRDCLSCKFSSTVTIANVGSAVTTPADKRVVLTSDSNAFYSYNDATVGLISDPVLNYVATEKRCLTISLVDQFNDGWGVAYLVVTSFSGARDKFTLQCTTSNPTVFSYCPQSMEKGVYNLHIEKDKETPFAWEILWKVATGTSWYFGDRDSHMFFEWNEKYEDFHIKDSKNLLPQYATCEICDPTKPSATHRRSLSNLRSLGHKGTTSSPTMSRAPTILATGYTGYVWNEFVFAAGNPWFESDHEGTYFWVSDRDGKHLFKTGTTCTTTSVQKCWVEIPDGDYILRVGDSTNAGAGSETYAFCESSYALAVNTELHFTVLDQQCYAGAFYELDNLCRNTYKSAFFLNVDVLLSGGVESLSASDESTLKVATSETMLSVLGEVPISVKVGRQEVQNSAVMVSMLLEFKNAPDSAALSNFIMETSAASSLLKYELIGTQSMAANFLKGQVASVSIVSASTETGTHDYSKVDESSFHTVEDNVWKTESVQQSASFNDYATYVAEAAYAIVAVAAVLAVSIFVKRAVTKKYTVVEA